MGGVVCVDLLGALEMMELSKDKLFWILLLLLSITLLSWGLSYSAALNEKNFGALLLVLAFLKVRLIVVHYMEANRAVLPLRIAFESWVIGVGLMTILLYLR